MPNPAHSGFLQMALGRTLRVATCLALVTLGCSTIFAQPATGFTDTVSYAPSGQSIQGAIPFVYSYQLSVTSPDTLTGSATVSLTSKTISTSAPAGVSAATALSYLSFSQNTLTFAGPSQTLTVTVTLNVPSNAIVGSYGYQIYAAGWPTGTASNNIGSSINAAVSLPVNLGSAPTVAISSPANLQSFSFSPASLPAQIPLTFVATATSAHPVLSVDANLSGPTSTGAAITLTGSSTNGNATVTATGNMTVSQAGTYIVQARATNDGGTASTSNTFTVSVVGVPPVVSITAPTPNQIFTIVPGIPSSTQFSFGATSTYGAITTMTASVNGVPIVFSPLGLNSLAVTATTGNYSLTAAGTYTLIVTATNPYGTATAQTTFTIVQAAVSPTPTIVINDPDMNQVFDHTIGTPALNVGFSFTTTTSTGFTVDSASATIDGLPATIDSTAGLGQVTATSTGSLLALSTGSHTFVATGVSAGIPVTTSVIFSIQDVPPLVPPTVVINTLGAAAGVIQSTFTLVGSSLNIPLSFTGTSNNAGGVITNLTATLDPGSASPVPLGVAWTSAGIAVGTTALNVAAVGQHTIQVTATDAGGTATASTQFIVIAATQQSISGLVFFDADFNGVQGASEPGLDGVTVTLSNGLTQVASAVTAGGGKYSFTVAPGTYTLTVNNSIAGLSPTTPNLVQTIAVSTLAVKASPVGFGLNFCAIRNLKSAALSQGYWKNNVSKALSAISKHVASISGEQVPAATMQSYTTSISTLALAPFAGMTLSTANSVFNSKSQLDLQLLASEYNYVSGAYINGSQPLTLALIYWGEIVKQNTGGVYSSSYQTFAASWFAAYNLSEGGYVLGPLP